MKLTRLLLWGILLPGVAMAGFEEEVEAEVQAYVETFSKPFRMQQHEAAESLAYTGHSDAKIFFLVESLLLDNYTSLGDSYDKDWASWLAKALGYSGDDQYQKTLQLLSEKAPDKKLRKYAKEAMSYTAQYGEWNKIILDPGEYDEQLSLAKNRYMNMLRSDIPQLHKLAAKRIFFEGVQDKAVTDLVRFRIKNPAPDADKDTGKWLTKSLCTECKTYGSRP